ncbi:hypothetical protein [Dyadobacter arcticus]|uniref:CO dehydrogenase/acetyl-CoA synthase epsilon subunit n=1 Tax=Dyadobacter arcticus TaxID=1078754 RepID=A0ABX0UHS3_9BACT|nr:hypothetical protein [Dyadobacter arcticus]NIJ52577.1 CO dehydrogenase/acetyl-CoA synthase epsilon subunit [Dyadobacter arcticus]
MDAMTFLECPSLMTEEQIEERDFDTVKTFGEIKRKISKDIAYMNFEQIEEYLQNKEVGPNA